MEVDFSSQDVVDESCCAVCGEIFLSPVVLCCIECDLSFCQPCLQDFWVEHGIKECPICFKESLGLPHKSCEAHAQRVFLLCVVDLEPVCAMCHRSELHENHRVFPIRNAFTVYKVRELKIHSVSFKSIEHECSLLKVPERDIRELLVICWYLTCHMLKFQSGKRRKKIES